MIYDPAQVENELLAVQRNVSPSEARTSLFNLVAFSTPETRSLVEQGVGYLLGRRPARVIHVRPEAGAKNDIHVSARCLLDDQNQSVCIQEVVIEVAEETPTPGLWSSLLIRDIPVYVLWLYTVGEREEELLLAWEQADKIVVDSARFDDSGDHLPVLVDLHATHSIVFADIAWRRITPLREAIATLFDTESGLGWLKEIASVDVADVPPVERELLVHWLAARLDWRPDGVGFLDAEGRQVALEPGRGDDLGRASARFRTFDGTELAARGDGAGCVHLTRPDGRETQTRVYDVPTIGEALLSEVDDAKIDQVYLETISLAAARRRKTDRAG